MAACVGPVICTSSSPGRNSPSESFPFLRGCRAARLKGCLPSGGRLSLASEAIQATSGQETSQACIHLASSPCGAHTLRSRVTLPWEGARQVCWAVMWGRWRWDSRGLASFVLRVPATSTLGQPVWGTTAVSGLDHSQPLFLAARGPLLSF